MFDAVNCMTEKETRMTIMHKTNRSDHIIATLCVHKPWPFWNEFRNQEVKAIHTRLGQHNSCTMSTFIYRISRLQNDMVAVAQLRGDSPTTLRSKKWSTCSIRDYK